MSADVRPPFTARRWIERALEDLDTEVAARRAAGEHLSEADVDALIEQRYARAYDEMPADAREYFVRAALEQEIQEFFDAEVIAGRMERLPDGTYLRAGAQ